MKMTRSAASRAKRISWLTTTMVMPARAHVAHDGEHRADELRIERRGRLVEQHDLRLERERAGDRDALLLAARELGRVGRGLVGEPDPLERRAAERVGLGARLAPSTLRSASVTFPSAVMCG